jgi:hypothetical protein
MHALGLALAAASGILDMGPEGGLKLKLLAYIVALAPVDLPGD